VRKYDDGTKSTIRNIKYRQNVKQTNVWRSRPTIKTFSVTVNKRLKKKKNSQVSRLDFDFVIFVIDIMFRRKMKARKP